ncbi:MAG TPA: hypothetical protein VJ692_13795, partial [Nitrospiraceae bacterium]|nr:hypothetical protein [Nitrospiraceae bacterium]
MPVDHAETWRRAKRILCVRLDTLGDVLMTGPAIRALKESSGQEPVSAGLGYGKAARPGALGGRAGEIVGENAQEPVLAGSVQGKNAHPALGSRAGEIAGEMVVKRHITLLTSPAGAVAARLMPEIDEVIVYEAPWMKATAHRHTSRPDLEMADRLRHEAFDAAVIFTVYSQNPLPAAFLCYLADIPLRLASCRENPYQLLTNWVRETEPDTCLRHEV